MAFAVLLTILGAVAVLGRVGFALYAMGLVRSKNSAATVTRAIADACVVTLAFWAVGAAVLTHTSFGIATRHLIETRLLFGAAPGESHLVFFHLAMFLLATGALVGAIAERCKFIPMCIASGVLAVLVLPIAGQWTWFGWLRRAGFIDIGGSAALHVSAGVFAAVAAKIVGGRTGKFNRDGSSTMIPGHNIPLVGVGLLLTIVAWIAALAGSFFHTPQPLHSAVSDANGQIEITILMSNAALNTILSAAAAGFASMLFGQIRFGKPDIVLAVIGAFGGLVAMGAGAGAVSGVGAVVIGSGAGLIVPLVSTIIDLRLRIDDPTGLIAVHAAGGAWGTLAVAFFACVPPLGHVGQMVRQLAGLSVIMIFSGTIALLVFSLLKVTMNLRAREADEFEGLDLAEHDIGAYPDFQQTMIKSYHLREM